MLKTRAVVVILLLASFSGRAPAQTYDGELDALTGIFASKAMKHGFPVAYKLPVGHGPNFAPLPLNADYELTPDGALNLIEWDWLG